MGSNILILGAGGQIGTELAEKLRMKYGNTSVITSDIHKKEIYQNDPYFEIIDAKDFSAVKSAIKKHKIDTVYLLAAMLSATGEKYPEKAWDLNMTSLFNVLNLAKEGLINQIFWPSSIAVFGPTTPKVNTPQHTTCEPTTVYGITKQVGERWCEYYHKKYGVDVRSIRYPGIISHKTQPGGGTTDYAVDIFHEALKNKTYTCFLSKNTRLPMMFMDDAIEGTLQLMATDAQKLTVWSSYNLGAMDFTPAELATCIKNHIPDFEISYHPDYRQGIADSWPSSINDVTARQDWGWSPSFHLEKTVALMIEKLYLKIMVNG